jgi:hypothetical protein
LAPRSPIAVTQAHVAFLENEAFAAALAVMLRDIFA